MFPWKCSYRFYVIYVLERDRRRTRNLPSSAPPRPKETEILWSDIAGRILINAVFYPIEYAKVLIQVKTGDSLMLTELVK